ncbi:hypothetical protein KC799_14755, partial [candidate division KSB1 bacterium]|nr:hypothetical protein [candidate division KSB1 bacterium]
VLEKMLLFTWIQPVMVALTILLGFVGFLVVRQREKQEKITTYTQRILLVLVLSCSVPMILTGLIFPMTNVYIWQLAPVFTALFFGVLLISSGAIFEFRFFYLGGILSWLGAIIMAYTLNSQLPIRAIVMICILIVGFIIPGILFNSKYKNAGQSNGS